MVEKNESKVMPRTKFTKSFEDALNDDNYCKKEQATIDRMRQESPTAGKQRSKKC